MTTPRPAILSRLVMGGAAAAALVASIFTAHCGGGATCSAVCENFVDKCYAPTLGGSALEDLAFNDCLEQCQERTQAVPEKCAAERDALLGCIADAPSVDCNDAQQSAACSAENDRALRCQAPSNDDDGTASTSSTQATSASTGSGTSPLGAACTFDDECASNLCNAKQKQCAVPQPEGSPCTFDDECISDLCNAKLEVCSVPQPDGAPCVFDDECISDLCNAKLQQCGVPGPTGGPCVFDDECQSQQCNPQNGTCV